VIRGKPVQVNGRVRPIELLFNLEHPELSPSSLKWTTTTLMLLSTATTGRSRFKTMFLAFQAADARDWHSNLVIALSHVGNAHQLQFHHIFPKAVPLRAAMDPHLD
jgi:hypothetical protein